MNTLALAARRCSLGALMVALTLLSVGCQMGNTATAIDTATVHQGQGGLVRVHPDGRAEFANGSEPGDRAAHLLFAPGQSFVLSGQGKHHDETHRLEVLSTDPAAQTAQVRSSISRVESAF